MNGNDKRFENDASLCLLLIRLGMGVIFLFFGIAKFTVGVSAAAGKNADLFEQQGTWLPLFLVTAFLYVLPFLEVALGFLLLIGLKTRLVLFVSGLLMVHLLFGQVLLFNPDKVAYNLLYVFVLAWGLFLSRYNRFSVDAFLCKGP